MCFLSQTIMTEGISKELQNPNECNDSKWSDRFLKTDIAQESEICKGFQEERL